MSKYKYGIKINGKIFAKNMTLEQCMRLSVKLGNKGISHGEYRYEDKRISNGCKSLSNDELFCPDCTDCVLKQIVELCKEQKVINCNIDGKEQVLKAYYHTRLGDKILELLDIQEVE